MIEDVCVIIRSIGEATTSLCYNLLINQVEKDSVIIVSEKPFVKAVEKTFQIGIERNKKWTLAIDADILLKEDAVRNLVEWANSCPEYYFEFQGRVLDKLFCANRPGGPHLYRTKNLSKALSFIPTKENDQRPESTTLNRMAESGYHYYQNTTVFGVHDFFQHPRDLFRKSHIHSQKHAHYRSYFLSQWHKRLSDNDYKIALDGLLSGLKSTEKSKPDSDYFNSIPIINYFSTPDMIRDKFNIPEIIDVNDIIRGFSFDKESIEFEKNNLFLFRRSDKMPRYKSNNILYKILTNISYQLKKLSLGLDSISRMI